MDALQSIGSISVQNAMAPRAGEGSNLGGKGGNVDAVAKDFEAMFMAQMLKPMFDTVEVNGLFGGGHGEEMMRGFLVQEYGKAMAQGSNTGLADSIKKDMIRLQELARAKGAAA